MSEATDIEHIRREAKVEALREFAAAGDVVVRAMRADRAWVPKQYREGCVDTMEEVSRRARERADRIEAGDE